VAWRREGGPEGNLDYDLGRGGLEKVGALMIRLAPLLAAAY
jgi:hypothetical protein